MGKESLQNVEFEKLKEAALQAAEKQGIVDVSMASAGDISIKTVELATKLMKKHGDAIYERLDRRRNAGK
jgi:hypothetical protein